MVMPWLAKASTIGVLTLSSAKVLGSAGFGSAATGSAVPGIRSARRRGLVDESVVRGAQGNSWVREAP